MKALGPKNRSQKLLSEVHLARIRLAKAEGQLASAREMARVARRRRKEAKQAARRTKKQARLAKREVTDAKLALAEAEEKLARYGKRSRKATSTRRPAKPAAVASRTKRRSPPPVAKPAPKVVEVRKPRRKSKLPKARIRRQASAVKPRILVPCSVEPANKVPEKFTGKPTDQIAKGVEQIVADEARALAPVETSVVQDSSE